MVVSRLKKANDSLSKESHLDTFNTSFAFNKDLVSAVPSVPIITGKIVSIKLFPSISKKIEKDYIKCCIK